MSNIIKVEDQKKEMDYFRSLVAIASQSGSYSNMKPETMLNIMLTAKDLGISPMKALNGGFYIVNGKLGMSTALMADRIRKEGHSIKITEWTSQKCVMIGKRKDNEDSIKFEYTIEDAQLAGLTNSPTWKKFPKQMLYNRAMSTLARTLWPDVIGCAYSEDEKHDIANIPVDRRPEEDPDMVTLDTRNESEVDHYQLNLSMIKEKLISKGIDIVYLDQWIEEKSLSNEGKKTKEEIAKVILSSEKMLTAFEVSYTKWLSSNSEKIAVNS